ncbi:MAG: GAF domain-containing protein [Chloroflexi bacterium]|nr:GAF domain-containing protein [Chloroflexota bacterium]
MTRLLLVDDDEQNLYLLQVLLHAQGYEIYVARDGTEALESARRNLPDVVISDILMPGMDGFTLCRAWKKDAQLGAIPFVFYTATYTDSRDEEFALNLGAERFIRKPAEPEVFVSILREVIAEHQQGKLVAPRAPEPEEAVYFKEYNATLVRKLEDKMVQLERANRDLENEIAERKQAEQELAHRAEQLALLYDAGLTLNRALDPHALMESLLQIAGQAVGADRADFLQYDATRQLLVYEAGSGYAATLDRTALNALTLPLGAEQGLGGLAAATRAPIYLPDVRADARWIPFDPTIRSALWVPVEREAELLGVLVMTSTRLDAFSPDDQKLVALFANQVAVALENARLFDETRRRLERMTALRAIDAAINASLDLRITLNILLDQTRSQLRVDAAEILLFDKFTHMFAYGAARGFRTRAVERTHLRIGAGLVGRVALERRIISVLDLTQDSENYARSGLLADEGFVSYYGAPLIAKGQIKGVLGVFQRSRLEPNREWLDFFEALAGQAAIAMDSAELFEGLQRAKSDLEMAYDTTLEGWSRALDLRDEETEGHTQRVTELTLRLAQKMGLSDPELVYIRRGALLHDIGKMGVPDQILLKPESLTDAEWTIMRKHPEYAYQLLAPIAYLRPALDIPYGHHEKWDGTGYPRGLKGEAIPLSARIFAIVDVWDALRSNRPYRAAWSEEKSRAYLREQSGKQFDPQIVAVFLAME